MKRPIVETSQMAYESLKAENVRDIYKRILNALKVLGSANTEKIADYIGVEHSRVHKRTKEMEGLEMIWRPGGKTLTKSGRQSFLWTIRGDKQAKTDNQAKETTYKKNDTTAAQYASNIIKQAELF
jgi:DNA-binding Lrp family transcriptional regulator